MPLRSMRRRKLKDRLRPKQTDSRPEVLIEGLPGYIKQSAVSELLSEYGVCSVDLRSDCGRQASQYGWTGTCHATARFGEAQGAYECRQQLHDNSIAKFKLKVSIQQIEDDLWPTLRGDRVFLLALNSSRIAPMSVVIQVNNSRLGLLKTSGLLQCCHRVERDSSLTRLTVIIPERMHADLDRIEPVCVAELLRVDCSPWTEELRRAAERSKHLSLVHYSKVNVLSIHDDDYEYLLPYALDYDLCAMLKAMREDDDGNGNGNDCDNLQLNGNGGDADISEEMRKCGLKKVATSKVGIVESQREGKRSRGFLCAQAPFGTFSHACGGYKNSYDFAATVGIPVTAPRNATVVEVADRHWKHGPELEYENSCNYVTLLFEDGSCCDLIHLRHKSLRVAVGDRVNAGDVLGCVGNTGFSGEPHVHVMVYLHRLVANACSPLASTSSLDSSPRRRSSRSSLTSCSSSELLNSTDSLLLRNCSDTSNNSSSSLLPTRSRHAAVGVYSDIKWQSVDVKFRKQSAFTALSSPRLSLSSASSSSSCSWLTPLCGTYYGHFVKKAFFDATTVSLDRTDCRDVPGWYQLDFVDCGTLPRFIDEIDNTANRILAFGPCDLSLLDVDLALICVDLNNVDCDWLLARIILRGGLNMVSDLRQQGFDVVSLVQTRERLSKLKSELRRAANCGRGIGLAAKLMADSVATAQRDWDETVDSLNGSTYLVQNHPDSCSNLAPRRVYIVVSENDSGCFTRKELTDLHANLEDWQSLPNCTIDTVGLELPRYCTLLGEDGNDDTRDGSSREKGSAGIRQCEEMIFAVRELFMDLKFFRRIVICSETIHDTHCYAAIVYKYFPRASAPMDSSKSVYMPHCPCDTCSARVGGVGMRHKAQRIEEHQLGIAKSGFDDSLISLADVYLPPPTVCSTEVHSTAASEDAATKQFPDLNAKLDEICATSSSSVMSSMSASSSFMFSSAALLAEMPSMIAVHSSTASRMGVKAADGRSKSKRGSVSSSIPVADGSTEDSDKGKDVEMKNITTTVTPSSSGFFASFGGKYIPQPSLMTTSTKDADVAAIEIGSSINASLISMAPMKNITGTISTVSTLGTSKPRPSQSATKWKLKKARTTSPKKGKSKRSGKLLRKTKSKSPSTPMRGAKWSELEKELYVEGLEKYGRDMVQVSAYIGSRDTSQVRSFTKRHLLRLLAARKPLPAKVRESGNGYTMSGKPLNKYSATAIRFFGSPSQVPKLEGVVSDKEEAEARSHWRGTWRPTHETESSASPTKTASVSLSTTTSPSKAKSKSPKKHGSHSHRKERKRHKKHRRRRKSLTASLSSSTASDTRQESEESLLQSVDALEVDESQFSENAAAAATRSIGGSVRRKKRSLHEMDASSKKSKKFTTTTVRSSTATTTDTLSSSSSPPLLASSSCLLLDGSQQSSDSTHATVDELLQSPCKRRKQTPLSAPMVASPSPGAVPPLPSASEASSSLSGSYDAVLNTLLSATHKRTHKSTAQRLAASDALNETEKRQWAAKIRSFAPKLSAPYKPLRQPFVSQGLRFSRGMAVPSTEQLPEFEEKQVHLLQVVPTATGKSFVTYCGYATESIADCKVHFQQCTLCYETLLHCQTDITMKVEEFARRGIRVVPPPRAPPPIAALQRPPFLRPLPLAANRPLPALFPPPPHHSLK